jgi:hypothetical protein
MTLQTHRRGALSIDAAGLSDVKLDANGAYFELLGRTRAGDPWSVNLPCEVLQNLILTLPTVAVNALRRKHHDESLRIVYPANSVDIELATDHRTFIVTLRTDDDFHVCFGLSEAQCESIGDSPYYATLMANRMQQPS